MLTGKQDKRSRYQTQVIFLRDEEKRRLALAKVANAPLDFDNPLELRIAEGAKKRSNDQNAFLWSQVYPYIAQQVFVGGRTYDSESWHEFFKANDLDGTPFYPEHFTEGLTLNGYEKWKYLPDGNRVCVASSTKLTKRGFSELLEKIYAFGATHGVQFGVSERDFA